MPFRSFWATLYIQYSLFCFRAACEIFGSSSMQQRQWAVLAPHRRCTDCSFIPRRLAWRGWHQADEGTCDKSGMIPYVVNYGDVALSLCNALRPMVCLKDKYIQEIISHLFQLDLLEYEIVMVVKRN